MRTHYYPNGLARYDSDGHDFVEQGPCGTWLGEASDLSGDWNRVDCKRCLKERPAITASSEAEERAIIAQMDDMAAHMQSAAPAHPAERQEQGEVQMLREALKHLLSYAERQICEHEETHRGGAIWEICDMCGAKWADDEGGKPEFKWPDEIKAAHAALLASAGQEVGK